MSKPPVRARDLRSAIKEQGFERGVVTTLEQMLDEHAEVKQHIREMAELVTLCIQQVESMIKVSTGMQGLITQMQRDHEQGEQYGKRNIQDGNEG